MEKQHSSTSTSTSTPSHPANPDPASFTEFHLSNTHFTNLLISPPPSTTTKPTPLFYVSNSPFTPFKPSVTLYSGNDKNGRVIGVVKLSCWRDNFVGLGDPDTLGDGKEGEVVWERLRKTSNWTHSTYEFELEDEKGERRTYEWKRLRQGFFADQPDMELREVLTEIKGVGEGQSEERNRVESRGEVLAVYKGLRGWKKRGVLFLRKGIEVGEMEKKGEGKNWEMMVLLTALGIIEAARRRARHRRSGGI